MWEKSVPGKCKGPVVDTGLCVHDERESEELGKGQMVSRGGEGA